jgi:site-specific DNA-cytosine methylase
MKLLDLFSGTGSVAKAAQIKGWSTTTLDKDLPADIQTDILEWDYKSLPPDSFDYIHASPPCTHYSKARTTAKTPRDIEGSNQLVKRTLDIIEYFNPKFFTIENPQSGLLKEQAVVQGLSYNDIDY